MTMSLCALCTVQCCKPAIIEIVCTVVMHLRLLVYYECIVTGRLGELESVTDTVTVTVWQCLHLFLSQW